MNLNTMNSNELFLIALAVVSFILIFRKITKETAILILVTILVGYAVSKDGILSIAIGLILGNIYVSLNTASQNNNSMEGFKSKTPKKLTKAQRKAEKKLKKSDRAPKELFTGESEDEDEDEDENEQFKIDTKGSFYENYKSLTPKQVKGLNKDTKALINTQKQLIETLNNMGPALKDGRQILDSFKNYFGNEADLGKALKSFKTK